MNSVVRTKRNEFRSTIETTALPASPLQSAHNGNQQAHSGRLLLASQPLKSHNNTMNAILARLEEIFRTVLLDDTLTLTPETSGKDFEAWDSLTHVTVMVHAERAFNIQFTSSEISGWQNAGELVQLIEDRLRQKADDAAHR